MKLNNVWGYGQIFGFSGIDGKNRQINDFVGTLTHKKIGIRFELKEWIKVFFPIKGRIKFHAITGDMIDAQTAQGNFFITFADCDTVVGYSPVKPVISGVKKLECIHTLGMDVYKSSFDFLSVLTKEENGLFKFVIHHSYSLDGARGYTKSYLDADVESLRAQRYNYFKAMPKCKNRKYERLYYKALSINKVNVHSPEGRIDCMWTTPDRVPHRYMWLWDSVFHALAIVNYNQELAKDAIRAVLHQAQPNGFIPHMMNPIDFSNVTQPQVLAWGVWEVYKKTGDIEFLKESVGVIENFLNWSIRERDKNGNGLLEWFTDPEDTNCKCGESGLDNSPRFDFDQDMDAIDFSTWLARDSKYLSLIFNELGDKEKSEKWLATYNNLSGIINKLLWCDEDGVYYDRLFDGTFSKILTPTCFLPLFANIPTKEQAKKMVKVLTNDKLLWSKIPLASISKTHPTYSNDMWRGGVWLNLNYFVIKGLKNYGYDDIADELLNKTLETVNKWYKKTGSIYEFYDPEDLVAPYLCERKGKPINPPDWRKKTHAISDYNWSACFTLLFIQGDLY